MQQPSRILAEKSGKRVQMQFICIIFVAIKLKSYVLLNQTRRFNTQKRIRTSKKNKKIMFMKPATFKDNNWSTTKTAMLRLFIEKGNHTVAELAAGLGVSIPYATKSLNELVEAQLVQEVGKRDNYSRRAPRVYDLIPTSGYFLGIDTGHDRLNLGIIDFCGNMVSNEYKMIYSYEDTNECFDMLTSKINDFIDASGIDRSLIRKACMSVGGRVNPIEGKAHNYFTCLNRPLAEALTESLGIEACIDNDTRCMTYGEYLKGCCKGYRNVVFVNISWGVGIGIIIDGKMYLGKSGYSGEIGHMHIYNNGIICHCGKTGCMETEASGAALQRNMTHALQNGAVSILSGRESAAEELSLSEIIDAIKREDVLSIDNLQKVAVELGTNLAGIINVFNPEILVIGGDLSVTGDYLTQPICMGIKKYSLNLVNEDSVIATSTLTDKAAVTGACLLAQRKLLQETN